MAKRKIELFIEVQNSREFDTILHKNYDRLICAEIYNTFAGSCTALDRIFTTIKLDWSNGQMVLLKVPADEIDVLERFRDHSEPQYMFILNKRVTTVFRGVDSMRLCQVAKAELDYLKRIQAGQYCERHTYELDEPTPMEIEWMNVRKTELERETKTKASRRAQRQAERKRHRAVLMAPHLGQFNFVLYWPHATYAHPELYERWDLNNIIMVGREELQLTEDIARDILYNGDAPLNEASMHCILSGPALAICFRILDKDRNFTDVVRKILYEDLPEYDEEKSLKEQMPRQTAYDHYKTYSLSKEEIMKRRAERRVKKMEELEEKRRRRLSEMQRMARQQIEEALENKRQLKEQKKLELLRSGNLDELEKLRQETDDEEVDILIPEELPEDLEPEVEEEEEEVDEYFPPPGLVIPAFYAPPNDIAKANGLAILFPKLVLEHVTPAVEFLPPHVLVLLNITKRYKAIEELAKNKSFIIHMGIFDVSTLGKTKHIAYTVRQYDKMNMVADQDVKLAFMLSVSSDIPLLLLMDLGPDHVSRDTDHGEDECAALFSVEYGDTYNEFEDFEAIKLDCN